jgi:hypothetical protein
MCRFSWHYHKHNFSKLFEKSVLGALEEHFPSAENQFGFKSGLGCSHAIFAARNVVTRATFKVAPTSFGGRHDDVDKRRQIDVFIPDVNMTSCRTTSF